MKSISKRLTLSIGRSVLSFLVLFLITNQAFSQLSDADKAKKDMRSLLLQLQNSETAKSTLLVKKDQLDADSVRVQKDVIAILAVRENHNKNKVGWDPKKPKPQNAIDYDNEKQQIDDKLAEIIKRLEVIISQRNTVKSELEKINFTIRSQRGVLKVKSIKVKEFFDGGQCPQMPGEVATVQAWKSYLDCLFDEVTPDQPGFVDPNDPGHIKVNPNDASTLVIPENDPVAKQQKQKEIKKIIDDSKKNTTTNTPIAVPAPNAENTNEQGGSLSAALMSLIHQIRNKIQSVMPK